MKQSSGTLLYHYQGEELQVLLVHPSGNYNVNAPWGIPKGIPDEGESLEDAARRETLEETGVKAGELKPLGYIDYKKSKKRVHCWAGLAPKDAAPFCASWEVDYAEWVGIVRAKSIIHPDQAIFLDRLQKMLG